MDILAENYLMRLGKLKKFLTIKQLYFNKQKV